MIEAKNLKKIYKTKKGVAVHALDGVSLKLPDTGMVFLLGKSGSGKSTLLNVLGGLDSFDSGEIIINGTSAAAFKQSHYDSYRNTYIGFIFQEYNILEELTVGANIALAIELQGRRALDDEINRILAEVDLDGYGYRKPNELSGGQKQRVAIARALVKKPEIIMADEPTGALDSQTGKQVFDTLKKLSKDKLVLIVSHDREFSEQYADRIIELKDGQIISDVELFDSELPEADFDTAPDSIEYGEGEITVKVGYTLTEEDRIEINKYLLAAKTDTKIKLSEKTEKRKTEKKFKDTDDSYIVADKNKEFKLIKSKLSLKNAFKIGSGALKHKKVRLVFTILLSLVSFTLFGLADTVAAYNNIETATHSIYDTGIDYASYIKAVKNFYDINDPDAYYWDDDGVYLTDADLETIKKQTGTDVIGVFNKNLGLDFLNQLGDKKTDGMSYDCVFSSKLSGITVLDSALMESRGISFVGNSSALPVGKNEIVITKYVYDYFVKKGYSEYDSTTNKTKTVDINSPDDLIGKTVSLSLNPSNMQSNKDYKIVGIVDTGFDYSRYEKLADDSVRNEMNFLELMTLTEELAASRNYSFAAVGFVSEDLFKETLKFSEAAGSYISGEVNLYIVKDDSNINSFDDLWYSEDKNSENNIIYQQWFSKLNTIDKAKDYIKWIGEEKSSLAENEIVIPASVLLYAISGNGSSGDDVNKLFDRNILTGFEDELSTKIEFNEIYLGIEGTLKGIFTNYKDVAVYKYILNNADTVNSVVFNKMQQYDPDLTEQEFLDIPLGERYSVFFDLEANGDIDYVTEDDMNSYREELITKYSMSDLIMPDALKDILLAKVTIDGVDYLSYDEDQLVFKSELNDMKYILAHKYAYLNFEDAKAYAKIFGKLTDEDLNSRSVEEIVGYYVSYILQSESGTSFTPSSSVSFDGFFLDSLVSIYNTVGAGSANKMLLGYTKYYAGTQGIVKNIKIVGISGSADDNDGFIVVGDEIASTLINQKANGTYSFAVGNMPESLDDIRQNVRFSNEYEIDGVKFILKNNVTEQLDWIDEMLSVLGRVFLYVGIGFAVFASLMLSNFIGTSVAFKKQEIGILRAIGSRSNDVFRIFFAEAFIIAMINYVLSVVGTLSVTLFINSMLRNSAGLLITFLNFGIRQVALLLAVSLFVAVISTFIPVKKIASMKPIDAIKNRK